MRHLFVGIVSSGYLPTLRVPPSIPPPLHKEMVSATVHQMPNDRCQRIHGLLVNIAIILFRSSHRLREKSTCPLCQKHIKLDEDFPALG